MSTSLPHLLCTSELNPQGLELASTSEYGTNPLADEKDGRNYVGIAVAGVTK
ncbi:hypothetical protein HDU93_005115, partial [Gonapodya sp. JEL0774]